jgi:hypothetical protein
MRVEFRSAAPAFNAAALLSVYVISSVVVLKFLEHMLSSVTEHSVEIRAICQRHGVRRLELFGSAARGDFDPSASDLDFLVEFISNDWHGAADRWFGLIEDLEALFDRKIDLVDSTVAKNPHFLRVIQPDRVELYAA